MEEIRDIDSVKFNPCAVTVGKFDGVHIGHRKLISTLMAEKGELLACVFTFDPVKSENIVKSPNSIISDYEKMRIFESMGIDKVILFPLTEKNASLSPEEFVKDILFDKLNCRLLVVGDDFRFGKNRAGDTELLLKIGEKLGIRVIVIKREEFEGEPVSSTRIREEIKNKNYNKADKMLGK